METFPIIPRAGGGSDFTPQYSHMWRHWAQVSAWPTMLVTPSVLRYSDMRMGRTGPLPQESLLGRTSPTFERTLSAGRFRTRAESSPTFTVWYQDVPVWHRVHPGGGDRLGLGTRDAHPAPQRKGNCGHSTTTPVGHAGPTSVCIGISQGNQVLTARTGLQQ